MSVTFTPLLISCQILENREISPGYYLIKVNSSELASRVIPGQFFDIRVTNRMDLVLRRPISIFDYDETSVGMLYEVVGKGTAILSAKKPGEDLDILGPLGNGYSLPMDARKAILAAGGIGAAPLFSWAKELIQMNKRGRKIDIEILIGAKNEHKILCEENFRKIGLNPLIATDDGSYGYKGYVTDLLKEQLTRHEPPAVGAAARRQDMVVYACGPETMLKNLSEVLIKNNIKGEMSMERWMGCGMGACLGCVVKTTDGKYKRACKDGPIFRADEIMWE